MEYLRIDLKGKEYIFNKNNIYAISYLNKDEEEFTQKITIVFTGGVLELFGEEAVIANACVKKQIP